MFARKSGHGWRANLMTLVTHYRLTRILRLFGPEWCCGRERALNSAVATEAALFRAPACQSRSIMCRLKRQPGVSAIWPRQALCVSLWDTRLTPLVLSAKSKVRRRNFIFANLEVCGAYPNASANTIHRRHECMTLASLAHSRGEF